MNCAIHSDIPAVAVCSGCGRALCESCAIHYRGAVTCKLCLEAGAKRKRRAFGKSTGWAAVFSLMPGLGQVYVGYYLRGFIFAIIAFGIIALLSTGEPELGPFLGPFLAFFWIFNMIDAAQRARMYNAALAGAEEIGKLPSDSPLAGGIVLLVLGLILTLEVTFGVDLEFLAPIWPLAILAGGGYLIWRYWRAKRELEGGGRPGAPGGERDDAPVPGPGASD
jgi:hypothetical protein